MYHEVNWTEERINNFIKFGNLSKNQALLISMRANEASLKDILAEKEFHGCSRTTIYRKLGELKLLYDKLSANDPIMFPSRKIKLDYPATLCNYSGKIYFTIDGNEDEIRSINLEGKEFTSSKEMLNYIYSQVCTITNKNLNELNQIKFVNSISYIVKFEKD